MENKNNQANNGQGFAIASLVIGIFALLFSIIPCVGTSAILIGIVAVVFGAVSLTKANTTEAPKGMSIAGISLGGLAIVIAIFWLIFVVGSKSVFQDKFEHFFEWAEDFEQIDINIDDEFDEMEKLENLENALDELEGIIDDVDGDIHEAVIEVKEDAKEAIQEAREEIEDAKIKQQEDDSKN